MSAEMATPKNCSICKKGQGTCVCTGCQAAFCRKHFHDHHTTLLKELDGLVEDRNYLQAQINKADHHHDSRSPILLQIDEWQRATIKKVTEAAEQARQQVVQLLSSKRVEIRTRVRQLSDELRYLKEGEDLVEQDLTRLKETIRALKQDLEQLPETPSIKLHIEQSDQITWSRLIYADDKSDNTGKKQDQQLLTASPRTAVISVNTKWTECGVTVAGGNGNGSGLNQFNVPFGLYVDYDQTLYIADYGNHRIVAWKCGAKSGEVVAGGNGPGKKADQLYQPKDVILDKDGDWLIISDYKNRRVVRWPHKGGTSGETIISDVDCTCLTMDDNGFLYVCDYKKNEVRRWQVGQTHGIVVAGGNGEGSRLNQFRCPTYVFVDRDHSVYVSDSQNHRVMKWMEGAKEGIIVAGHGGAGSALTQLVYPCGVVVDQLGTVYVADCNNHRIMRWLKGATHGSVLIGGNGAGEQANQLRCPDGLAFDQHGNIYVSNFGNHRVVKFSIDASE